MFAQWYQPLTADRWPGPGLLQLTALNPQVSVTPLHTDHGGSGYRPYRVDTDFVPRQLRSFESPVYTLGI